MGLEITKSFLDITKLLTQMEQKVYKFDLVIKREHENDMIESGNDLLQQTLEQSKFITFDNI